ncbi:MAG: choice-of-anchor D domain-containing protein, partial [Pseudomonadota bacterium]
IVTWLPTSKGLAQGVMMVRHSGKSGMAQVELKGVLQPPESSAKEADGRVEISPESMDFGTSPGGIALVRSVILSNNASKEMTIKSVALDVPEQSGFSFKSQCPEILLSGKSCNLVITWLPTSKGLAQGVLTVQHSGKDGMTQAEIRGTLQPDIVKNAALYPEAAPDKGLLISDKEFIDFGSGIKMGSAITVTLVNSGSSDLTIGDIKLSLEDSDLSVSETGCGKGRVLKPVEACPLTVAWLPSHAGAILNSLQIVHTGTRGVLVMPVRGIADSSAGSQGADDGGDDAWLNGAMADDGSFGTSEIGAVRMKQMLGAYTVTSHSSTRAVINGPAGALVVRDGEDVVISGIKVTVTIVSTGVILSGDKDEVMLVFDRSLRLPDQAASDAGSGGAGDVPTAPAQMLSPRREASHPRIAPVTPPPLSGELSQPINP